MSAHSRLGADPVLLGLLALSLAGNVWLGREVRRLRAFAPPVPKELVGTHLPALSVLDPKGVATSITFEGQARPTVLYVFSPTCVWCQRNADAIAALAREAGGAYRFLGLCLGEHGACLEANDRPPFITYSQLASRQLDDLGLGTVPQTMMVTSEGKVASVFRGAYVGRVRGDVERFFAIKLALPEAASSVP